MSDTPSQKPIALYTANITIKNNIIINIILSNTNTVILTVIVIL